MKKLVILLVLAIVCLACVDLHLQKVRAQRRSDFQSIFGIQYPDDSEGVKKSQDVVTKILVQKKADMEAFSVGLADVEKVKTDTPKQLGAMGDQLNDLGLAYSNAARVAYFSGFAEVTESLGYKAPCGCF